MIKYCPIEKFVLFGLHRSGSTTLLNLLSSHPQIENLHYEPFKRIPFKDPQYDMNSLKREVKQIWGHSDGFKIHYYHLPWDSAKWVLSSGCKVIFLDRRNILRNVVSNILACKTNVWGKSGELPEYGCNLPIIELHWVRNLLNEVRWAKSRLDWIKKAGIPYYHFVYEDFYFGDGSMFQEILEFIGREPLLLSDYQTRILCNRYGKINDEGIYLKIPNVYDIERTFGNKIDGYLLNGGYQM